jgi:hypothetical protein
MMSHFSVYVIIPGDGDVKAHVDRMLAPYNEETHDDGRWDWYQLGGRWSGALDGYDPETDPANRKPCDLCDATGTRRDMVVVDGCNGCGGTGIMVVWPTQWVRRDGDVQPVSVVIAELAAGSIKMPFAVVAGDGRWYAQGEMGWFACVSNEQPADVWATAVRKLFATADAGMRVAVVDCHT